MDDSLRLVVIIYFGFLLGLLAISMLTNLVIRISRKFEDSEHKRSRLAH